MSSPPIIRVENLGKKYVIAHNQPGRSQYRRLSEELISYPRRLLSRLSPFASRHSSSEDFWALKDIDFEVRQGEVLGIIGRNGAGKSTLLKLLSRITEPTTGRIELNGRVASLLEVGTGFHPELTGRENIFLNGAILGMNAAEIRKKFDEIVAFAEVEKFLDTPVKRYSSGMYVRLAFAVAAHLEPEILVVDEVLAVGDVEFQKKCLGKMRDAATGGRTILFVTHNMTAVATFCSRVVCIRDGQLADDGEPSHVVAGYIASYTSVASESSWDSWSSAPGTEHLKINNICVSGRNQIGHNQITINDDIRITTGYWTRSANYPTHLTYVVINEEGIVCFSTFAESRVHKEGQYCASFEIPANWLNSGTYLLNLYIVRDASIRIFECEQIASFEVVDNEKRIGGWMGREPGVLRPKLDWSIEEVISSDCKKPF